jgi:hypothetical protein
VDNLELGKLAV